MNRRILIISIIMMGLLSTGQLHATTYFSYDAENGYQYMGSSNAHPGGGYFSLMGGGVDKPEGNGCSDPASFHNTILSTDADAQGSITTSNYSLKTPYNSTCPKESFTRDTTVIATPVLYEGYIRWDQKWTGDWNSSTVQQKFFKAYDGTSTGSATPPIQFSFGPKSKNWRALLSNIDGQFNKDAIARASQLWVYASSTGQGSVYSGVNRSYDDYFYGINGTDGEFNFETGRWYSLEFHWKINKDANTSDGVLEAWVDGIKVFGCSNLKFFNTGTRPFVKQFELQHVYYDRTAADQPAYIDNIIISDTYNGPLSIPIKPPSNLIKVTVTP